MKEFLQNLEFATFTTCFKIKFRLLKASTYLNIFLRIPSLFKELLYGYSEIYKTAIFRTLSYNGSCLPIFHLFFIFRDVSERTFARLLQAYEEWDGYVGLSVMSQYRPYMTDKFHVVTNVFYNSYAIHYNCGHKTTNCPDIRFLTLLRQCWCIISIVISNHNIKS